MRTSDKKKQTKNKAKLEKLFRIIRIINRLDILQANT